MALRDVPSALGRLLTRDVRTVLRSTISNGRRQASSEALAMKEPIEDFQELESQSSLTSSGPSEDVIKTYDPVKRSQGRRRELPPSR
jgi:large subunit ribosomal protein L5